MTRLLITGASGYLGGTLLNDLVTIPNLEIYALVRTESQASTVRNLGVRPVEFDLMDQAVIQKVVEEFELTVILHLADAFSFVPPEAFIRGLAVVKRRTGKDVHFIHTSGAKIFSSHTGINQRLNDTKDVYSIQKATKAPIPFMQKPVDTVTSVLELGDELGVRTYVYVPPMVHGLGEGFGNKISIQFVRIVEIGLALKRIYQVAGDTDEWPMCHLKDITTLYMSLVNGILEGKDVPHGKKGGYYFAVNGEFSWKKLYEGIASSMSRRGLVDDVAVIQPSAQDYDKMAQVLGGPKAIVDISVAGRCALTGDNGRRLGWVPKYGVDHLYSVIDEEVEFIIKHLKK
ncbi:NAD-P-binding protein [Guyanagaster necrorhizus]|uniref:NAD-P-binding protein n=1 Tax=Guyanagaster necrorhizus TaxID=856835 RepID=A0A9P7VIB1_9AGAR|nr:NAD-P-binding protein [Guyanagaster necrorhizus MCA 3950]KAG7441137.1 NAD-P-binding protein [Guyanagaster necrorhizus MCA 3950]